MAGSFSTRTLLARASMFCVWSLPVAGGTHAALVFTAVSSCQYISQIVQSQCCVQLAPRHVCFLALVWSRAAVGAESCVSETSCVCPAPVSSLSGSDISRSDVQYDMKKRRMRVLRPTLHSSPSSLHPLSPRCTRAGQHSKIWADR